MDKIMLTRLILLPLAFSREARTFFHACLFFKLDMHECLTVKSFFNLYI